MTSAEDRKPQEELEKVIDLLAPGQGESFQLPVESGLAQEARSQTSAFINNAKNGLLSWEAQAFPVLSHFVVILPATATRWQAVFRYSEKLILEPKSESWWARETDTSYSFRSD